VTKHKSNNLSAKNDRIENIKEVDNKNSIK